MRKAAKTMDARVKRTLIVRHVKPSRSETVIDERVIAQVDDDSAWVAPIDVRRRPK
jgi:hypothetical protein